MGVLIADASGHGPRAAVLMAMIRTLARTSPEAWSRPAGLLLRMNQGLIHNIPAGQFVTACYAVIDPRTGRVDYAVAGHCPPMLVRRDSSLRELRDSSGLPLGLFETSSYLTDFVHIGSGDSLLLYTDGFTEAYDADGSFLGERGLESILSQHGQRRAEELRDELVAAWERQLANPENADDMTLILIRKHD